MSLTSEKSIEAPKKERQETMSSNVTICGRLECICSQVMTMLANAKTPHLFAYKNFTQSDGPEIPCEFMEEYGDEVDSEVYLDVARGNKLVTFKVEVERNLQVVRLGMGWKHFYSKMEVKLGEMLCFTLEGQSRFRVINVRGHSYEIAMQFEKERLGGLGYAEAKSNSNFQKDVEESTQLEEEKTKGKVCDVEKAAEEVVVHASGKEEGSTTGNDRGQSQSLGGNISTISFSDFPFSASGFESYLAELINTPRANKDYVFTGLWEWMESEKKRLSNKM